MCADVKRAEIFLVPGFLGFETLGNLEYFLDVGALLRQQLEAQGIEATVHSTETLPAGSLRHRAIKLAREVAEHHDPTVDSVHFVGHSTGGVDIRVLLSPGSTLDDGRDLEAALGDAYASFLDARDKTRSATGVATPHHGTPIANYAMRLSFDVLLRGASGMLERDVARAVLSQGLRLAGMATSVLRSIPGNSSFLKWVGAKVLTQNPDFVLRYLTQVGADVGLLRNLTQEGMNLADALLIDRPGVRYGSIVTGTEPPRGPIPTYDPILYVNTLLFRGARKGAADTDPDYPYPDRVAELREHRATDVAAGRDVGVLTVDARTNDGVVPSLSQAYGEILGVFASDHLDCVGHYPHILADGTAVSGWVRSGASFSKQRFELLWGRVADFVVRSASAKRTSAGKTKRKKATKAA